MPRFLSPDVTGSLFSQRESLASISLSGLGEEAGLKPAKISLFAPRPQTGFLRRPDVHALSGVEADDEGMIPVST